MKRLFDIAAALTALFLLSPVILVVALLVRRKLGAPVFFRQTRPGLQGKPFKMVKFAPCATPWTNTATRCRTKNA